MEDPKDANVVAQDAQPDAGHFEARMAEKPAALNVLSGTRCTRRSGRMSILPAIYIEGEKKRG
jgi:hypothetical protein